MLKFVISATVFKALTYSSRRYLALLCSLVFLFDFLLFLQHHLPSLLQAEVALLIELLSVYEIVLPQVVDLTDSGVWVCRKHLDQHLHERQTNEAFLVQYFGVRVELEEFQGAWSKFEESEVRV